MFRRKHNGFLNRKYHFRGKAMDIILHFPKTKQGWHVLTRHVAAVSELIELDRQGKLIGPLEKHIYMLTPEDEEAALARAINKKYRKGKCSPDGSEVQWYSCNHRPF